MPSDQALLIIPRVYNHREVKEILLGFSQEGIQSVVASTHHTVRRESKLQVNQWRHINHLIEDACKDEWLTVSVMAGDSKQTSDLWYRKDVWKLFRSHYEAGKIVAGGCWGVPAMGPILEGHKVSSWPILRIKERLRELGAIVLNTGVAVDGNIVTGEDPERWAASYVDVVAGRPPRYNAPNDQTWVPPMWERKPLAKTLQQERERRGLV